MLKQHHDQSDANDPNVVEICVRNSSSSSSDSSLVILDCDDISDGKGAITAPPADHLEEDDFAMALRLQEELDREDAIRRQRVAESTVAMPRNAPSNMDLPPEIINEQHEIMRDIQSKRERSGQGSSSRSAKSFCVIS